jgi:hypothetical protein
VPVAPADPTAFYPGDDPVRLGLGAIDVVYLQRLLELLQDNCLHARSYQERGS